MPELLQQGPTSQEVGGLKLLPRALQPPASMSHLAGGGWIEIAITYDCAATQRGPTSQEVGGLKY